MVKIKKWYLMLMMMTNMYYWQSRLTITINPLADNPPSFSVFWLSWGSWQWWWWWWQYMVAVNGKMRGIKRDTIPLFQIKTRSGKWVAPWVTVYCYLVSDWMFCQKLKRDLKLPSIPHHCSNCRSNCIDKLYWPIYNLPSAPKMEKFSQMFGICSKSWNLVKIVMLGYKLV